MWSFRGAESSRLGNWSLRDRPLDKDPRSHSKTAPTRVCDIETNFFCTIWDRSYIGGNLTQFGAMILKSLLCIIDMLSISLLLLHSKPRVPTHLPNKLLDTFVHFFRRIVKLLGHSSGIFEQGHSGWSGDG